MIFFGVYICHDFAKMRKMRDVDKKEKRILDDAITMKKDLDLPSFRCGKEKNVVCYSIMMLT